MLTIRINLFILREKNEVISLITKFILITCISYNSIKSQGSGILITLGAVTIGTLGILTYAKGNPKVRAVLEGWIPGTDEIIRVIFQEDKNSNYFDFVFTFFETMKQT